MVGECYITRPPTIRMAVLQQDFNTYILSILLLTTFRLSVGEKPTREKGDDSVSEFCSGKTVASGSL